MKTIQQKIIDRTEKNTWYFHKINIEDNKMKMITTTDIKTPANFDRITRQKMEEAGLVKIEQDFISDEGFTKGWSGETRYYFNDGTSTDCGKKFKKRVYNINY